MRQGPHKNRSRSRGRRPTNSLGRVYESNGPDVKVRGTAQHVADKYMQLARDAHSAGDTVMAEGYYQHAEHYLRILAAAQPHGQQTPQRRPGSDDYAYDDGDDQGDDDQSAPVSTGRAGNGETQSQPPSQPQSQPQPQPEPQQPPADLAPSAGEAGSGEQPWGGPEPEFLRRSPSNGSSRTRRPRKSNGRSQSEASADGSDGSDSSGPATEDTSEQPN